MRRRAVHSLLLLSLSSSSCSRPARPEARAEAAGSAAASGAAAAVSGSREGPAELDAYELVHDLEFTGTLDSLDGALVVCEGTCAYPGPADKAPRAALVSGRDKPDASVFPRAQHAKNQASVVQRKGRVRFLGRHPDAVWSTLDFAASDAGGDRSNWSATGLGSTTLLRREGGVWVPRGAEELAQSVSAALPHERKRALLEAHLRPRQAVVGWGGPIVRLRDELAQVLVTKGSRQEWEEIGIPWRRGNGLRLADGRSVLVSGSAWLLGKGGGKPEKVPGVPQAKLVWPMGGVAWLVTEGDGHTRFYAPKHPEAFAVRGAPAPRAAGAPAASLGFPKKRTDACATPWVTLSTPPELGWKYGDTRSALANKVPGLQPQVTFVEYQEGSSLVFGAQCKTAKACDELAEAFEKATKGKPSAGCLDALAAIPDPDAPPPNARIVYIDLETGDLL